MALDTKLSLSILATFTSGFDLSTVGTTPLSYPKLIELTSGTGADQADKLWFDQRTLSASATENIDLAGTLVDVFGATVTFARVKLLGIFASSGNTNLVQVGGHATAAFVNWVANSSDILQVRPGGGFLLYAPDATGYAVTATTADMLKVTNSAGSTSVTYDIIIIGSSA